jgi:hypothetical protein
LFCPVSPEAELLKKELLPMRGDKTNPKPGKGLTEKRAGSMACGPKLFSVLIFFGPFLYQDKKGLAPAAIERRVSG